MSKKIENPTIETKVTFIKILIKSAKCFLWAFLVKLALSIVSRRKVPSLKHLTEMAKFGGTSSLFSSIFLIMRWLLIKIRGHDALSKIECFLGGFISSLALLLLNNSDLGILKLIFYPRVFDYFVKLFGEKINYNEENEP